STRSSTAAMRTSSSSHGGPRPVEWRLESVAQICCAATLPPKRGHVHERCQAGWAQRARASSDRSTALRDPGGDGGAEAYAHDRRGLLREMNEILDEHVEREMGEPSELSPWPGGSYVVTRPRAAAKREAMRWRGPRAKPCSSMGGHTTTS